jgi:Fic family protein
LLHFWIGYLHPFADGNGRMARVLFYWYLLRKSYWGFAYLSLSRIIKNSWGQYRDAYIYTEQDDNDLTYFIDYNIRKIQQAKREF